MNENICFNKAYFLLLVLAMCIIFIFQYFQLRTKYDNCKKNRCQTVIDSKINGKPKNVSQIREVTEVDEQIDQGPPVDIVRQYDYNRINDQLEEPVRRVARYEIPPEYLKRSIDIPTRGYPDNFTQFGTLVKGKSYKNEDNKILRLFGRQEYPGSYRYEYYTAVSSGNDYIKIPIETKSKKELYDGDKIYIKELKDTYTVQLYKYDSPKYYPDIIF